MFEINNDLLYPSSFSLQNSLDGRIHAMRTELKEIKRQFNRYRKINDTLGDELSQWMSRFEDTLRFKGKDQFKGQDHPSIAFLDRIEKKFISALQEILQDPISNTPLDERAFLTNDGNTYNRSSLELCYRLFLETGENSEPFMISDQPILVVLLSYLESKGAKLKAPEQEPEKPEVKSFFPSPSPCLEEKNQPAPGNEIAPRHPSTRAERLQKVRAQEEKKREAKRAAEEAEKKENEEMKEEMKSEIKEQTASIIAVEYSSHIAPIFEETRNETAAADKNLEEAAEESQNQSDRFAEEIDAAKKKIGILESRNEEIDTQIRQYGNLLSQAESDELALEKAVNELNIATVELRKKRKESIRKACFAIGCSILASYGFSYLSGMAIAAVPAGQGTGAVVHMKIPISI